MLIFTGGTVLRAKTMRRLILYAFIWAVTLAFLVAGFVLIAWIQAAPKMDIDQLQLDFTSFIYAKNADGQDEEIMQLHDLQNRVWVGINEIPEHMKNAVIATEDRRFWKHSGIDIRRTAYAAFEYLTKGHSSFGGSTITQQLVKNITDNDEVTVKRKVQEMWLAAKLERKIGKERVLELYLNTVFFGEGAYGVEAAAHSYFAKDVTGLSLAQAASIAGITQQPQKYNPFLNEAENKEKQMVVLGAMLDVGFINQAEYESAAEEPLEFAVAAEEEEVRKYAYFVDQVLEDVLDDLQSEKGYSRAMASKLLYTGGLKIHSTVDRAVQEGMENVFTNNSNFPDPVSEDMTNAAMVVMDPYTGEVKGIVGGRGENRAMRTLNRATQSLRQPGSAIKPIAVYAPALDQAIITEDTVFTDDEYTIEGWTPKNWYGGYWGNVSVRTAVEQSINVVAVKVLTLVGPERSFEFMKNNLGVTTLVENEVRFGEEYTDKSYSPLSLGGLTDGMTVQEMAAAYAPFANGGIYRQPHTYSVVYDHSGEVILNKKEMISTHIAMREQTAYSMTRLLWGVVERGTGTGARLSGGMPAAGKTGTTSEDKDRWFAGYTPYYVGAVWFGHDVPKSMERLLSGKPNPAALLWKRVMDIIHRDLPNKSFPQISWSNQDNRGTLTLDGRRFYEGEIKNGMAEGYGMMTYPSGDRYSGEFLANRRHGDGVLLYANGNRYVGQFADDEINGTGTLVWSSGDSYTGEWKNGKFNGEGTFVWMSGDVYSGGWIDEKFNGYGVFKWANGDRYEGEWKDGAFNGEGKLYRSNNTVTGGKWENGELTGH